MQDQFPHIIKIDWQEWQGTIWWNETCALVLEVFGLPGHRYIYKPAYDYMEFSFKSKKDYTLAQLLLSDRAIVL